MQGHNALANPVAIDEPPYTSLGSNLSFMARLNLLDLTRLTNDTIYHQAQFLPMPTKLLSNIPKFEWKAGETPKPTS